MRARPFTPMPRPTPRSLRAVAGAAALAVVGSAGLALPPLFADGAGDAVLDPAAGALGDTPVVSGDGRRVVSVAPSGHMLDAEGRGLDSVWLLDRATGVRTELTVPVDGARPGRSVLPVLSEDGCTVVVVTEIAYDLFRDDDHGDRWDVYRTVVPGCADAFEPGEWELVSATPDAEAAATDRVDPTSRPAVNGSGEIVAFTVRPPSAPGTAVTWTAVQVADLTVALGEAGRVTDVPGLPSTGPVTAGTVVGQRDPAVSIDGRYLAFVSDALPTTVTTPEGTTSVSAAWTDQVVDGTAVTQVVRWDRTPGDDSDGVWFRVVSATPDGRPGNASSRSPALAASGEIVVFSSLATDLLPAPVPVEGAAPVPVPLVEQVYRSVPDGFERSIQRVSEVAGVAGNGPSTRPAVDGSGRLVAFETRADNLLLPAPSHSVAPDAADLLLVDTELGTVRRLTVRPDGQPASFGSRSVSLSSTARVIVYATAVAGELGREVSTAEAPLDPDTGAPRPVWQVMMSEFPARVTSAALDLGTVEVGVPSQEWFTTVVNEGDSTFVPEVIASSSPEFAVTGGSCQPLVAVGPGESCTVEVTFTPGIAGPAAAEIVVAERGFDAAELAVAVNATAGTPTISASPSAHKLGDVHVGLVGAPATVTVTNDGAYETDITSVTPAGSNPGDVAVLADSCTGATVAPAASCQVVVALAPTEAGGRSATLTARASNGGTAGVVLVGAGKYTPLVGIRQTTVTSGDRIDVDGLGFPVSTYVSVAFAGSDQSILVLTDARGEFRTRLVVPRRLGTGRVSLAVVDPLGRHEPVASNDVLVVARPTGGATSPAHRAP